LLFLGDIMSKNIDYWESLLREMPATYKKSLDKENDYLIKNITKNSKVLEVGCGGGRSLNQLLCKTENIVGIDNDKKAVDLAKNNLRGHPKIKLIKCEARKLPFKANSFDFVICMTTFANFGKEKFKILSEMKRTVKPRGSIIMSVYANNAFKERMKIYKKLKIPLQKIVGTTVFLKEENGRHVISEQFSKAELTGIFNRAKLRVIEIKRIGILYACKLKKPR